MHFPVSLLSQFYNVTNIAFKGPQKEPLQVLFSLAPKFLSFL